MNRDALMWFAFVGGLAFVIARARARSMNTTDATDTEGQGDDQVDDQGDESGTTSNALDKFFYRYGTKSYGIF